MFGATVQNIVFYSGAFAISLELFVVVSAICSRGNDNQTLAKIIYALFGAGVAWIIDYSIHYSEPLIALLEVQFAPSSPLTFLALFLAVIALWYGCLVFIEKIILPKRNNNHVDALLAAVLAAFLAITIRTTYLTPVIEQELESEGIFLLGFIVSAGIFFASLLYYANRLLTSEFEEVIPGKSGQ